MENLWKFDGRDAPHERAETHIVGAVTDDDMIPLSESLRLLVAIADAYAILDERTGVRQPLFTFYAAGSKQLQHHGLPEGHLARVDEELLDGLASSGLIRVDYGGQNAEKISVTEEGDEVAAQVRRVLAGDDEAEGPAVELDWETAARPVLEAAYREWRARGAPPEGVLTTAVIAALGDGADVAQRTRRVIAALSDAEYLSAAGPLHVADAPAAIVVTSRGLQVVGGWPATTAEAATHALLVALDRAIEEATEPERRTKLQRLRETVLDVGQSTVTEVLARVVTSGL